MLRGKSKDNMKVSQDQKEYCRRKELELHDTTTRIIVKLQAKYCLTLEKQRIVYESENL